MRRSRTRWSRDLVASEHEERPLDAGLIEGAELGTVPLLGEEIYIDDQDATIVMIFPRGQEAGGKVDHKELIEEPLEACRRIFVRRHNPDSANTVDADFDCFRSGPVSAELYHNVVRRKVLRLLEASGIKADTFESIDGDEVFAKLSLARRGEVICNLAQRYQYKLPFRCEAYSECAPRGCYLGSEPMRNGLGQPVPAYTEFEFELKEHLEPFREVDEVRLLFKQLDAWLHLGEMKRQNVISSIFAGAKYATVRELHAEWGSLKHLLDPRRCLPNEDHDDAIRDYFGETIAFFFKCFAFYTRMLVPLGLLGLIAVLRNVGPLDVSLRHKRYFQIAYAFATIAWATVFNELWKNQSSRAQQRWGMRDYDATSPERATYRPELEGTWKLMFWKQAARACVVAFVVHFVAAVLGLQYVMMHLREGGHSALENLSAYITTGMIRMVSFIWGRIAPRLADIQNHRTEARWNDAITWMLASVKIFVALFPMLNLAFFKKYFASTCASGPGGGTVAEAAWKVYGPSHSWPEHISVPLYADANGTMVPPIGNDFLWLSPYVFTDRRGQTCVYGCFPVSCPDVLHDGHGTATNMPICTTNCHDELLMCLLTFYLSHVAMTVIFLLIPIALTKWSVHQEIREAAAAHEPYSFMQFQAKCDKAAPYQYFSWGGSQVEDFLELAIGFALLTSFGVIMPGMSFLALISHIVEYRLLAYRMTNVTCRPIPLGSEGIGDWQSVFNTLSIVAAVINVVLAVFVMQPMRSWKTEQELFYFIALEHAMLLLRGALASMIPDEPDDVKRVEDFNNKFKMRFAKYSPLHVPPTERYDLGNLDLGLRPTAAAKRGVARAVGIGGCCGSARGDGSGSATSSSSSDLEASDALGPSGRDFL